MSLFNYQGQHHCPAAVLSCIDFRFWQAIVDYVRQDLGIKDFDFPSVPGAAKALLADDALALSCITIPMELHGAKQIIIVNHADCGAYGGSAQHSDVEAEAAFHADQLKQAKVKVLAIKPEAEVILLYAKLMNEGQELSIIKVE